DERGGRLRVHRARQGALAAVPDLADPARPGRPRAARAGLRRALYGGDGADAALVPVPLLAARAQLRRDLLVARLPARPRPARSALRARLARARQSGTRIASIALARPLFSSQS